MISQAKRYGMPGIILAGIGAILAAYGAGHYGGGKWFVAAIGVAVLLALLTAWVVNRKVRARR